MALISQSIKNLKGGISQQPDILRYPEQGAAQINGWSSETAGLQKRAPMVYNKTLGAHGSFGDKPLVHLINRDEYEQYHVVFTGTDVRVFDLDGNEKEVRGDRTYIQTTSPRDDLRMVTVADYTFIVNRKTKVLRRADKTDGGNYRPDGQALINVRGGQYGRTLSVDMLGARQATFKIPNGSGTGDHSADVEKTDAQFLANELANQLRDKLGGSGWQFVVGSGYIHIIAPANAVVSGLVTADGYANQLINAVPTSVQTFAQLPINAPNGYLVRIVGDTAKSGDAYYVVYDAEKKVWKERVGWNIEYSIDDNTMPWTLIRAADGNFDLIPQNWGDRTAGDVDTNPWPSMVDSTINDVFFFRNRLGFLSGENIILSRTARYFDFFPASVATLSDDDPIDVAVSFNRVSILKYAVPFSEELLLWADEAQFVLGAGGVLTSKSVELNLTTQFDVQDRARPFGIGRGIFFASPRATFTSINRYYAVQDVSSVKSAEDMSAHVPSYIPNGVFSIGGSSAENFACILSEGAPGKVFIYKFLYVDEESRQQSWSHWDFGDNVTVYAASMINSRMNLLLTNGIDIWSAYVLFTKGSVDISSEPYRIYMDCKTEYLIPAGAYNDDLAETTVNLETVYGQKWLRGKVSIVEMDGKITTFEPLSGDWRDDPVLHLPGNLEGKVVFVGFNIDFRYEFSKFLIKKTADDGTTATEDIGRLQLRRAWINYEDSGAFTVEVANLSRVFSYDMAGGRLGSDNLRVGRLNLGTGQYKFPVVGNATTNTVTLISDTTTPLSIIGCGWEGNYIRRSSGI